jgi:hypothetical protein
MMAKFTDEEIYEKIDAFDKFRIRAEPLIASISEIKKTQDAMVTANAVSVATEEQRMDGAATKAVKKLQQSWSYRIRQIALILSALITIIGAFSISFGKEDFDASKLDYKALAEAIKEIGK